LLYSPSPNSNILPNLNSQIAILENLTSHKDSKKIEKDEDKNKKDIQDKVKIDLKKEEVLSVDCEKIFKDVKAQDYKTLQLCLQKISEEQGFDLMQNTGLKSQKYAYFYCSFEQPNKNSNKNQEDHKDSKVKNKQKKESIFFILLCFYFQDLSCPFEVRYIYNKENKLFALNSKSNYGHNHDLNPKPIINKEVLKVIEDLLIHKSHTPKELHEKINLKFDKNFNYSQIRNTYYKVKASLFGIASNEAQDLIQLLKALKDLGYVCFDIKSHPQKKNLEAVIFATPGMLQLFQKYKDMAIMDTTFGLNRFNMPVLTMAGVDNEGKTIIFGFAFLQDESYEIKRWVFETFKSFVRDSPEAFITDGCPAFAKALREVFPLAKHYLCSWHIQLNLKKHFSGFKKTLQKKK